jgi:hypothetical protein
MRECSLPVIMIWPPICTQKLAPYFLNDTEKGLSSTGVGGSVLALIPSFIQPSVPTRIADFQPLYRNATPKRLPLSHPLAMHVVSSCYLKCFLWLACLVQGIAALLRLLLVIVAVVSLLSYVLSMTCYSFVCSDAAPWLKQLPLPMSVILFNPFVMIPFLKLNFDLLCKVVFARICFKCERGSQK